MAYDTHRCRQSLVKRSFPFDSRVPEGVAGQFGDRRMVGVCKKAGRKAGFLTEQKGVLMDSDTLLFFQKHPAALPIYEVLERKIQAAIKSVEIRVQKTQITFTNRHVFACVSFQKVKPAKELPEAWIVVTFGLDHPVESTRIAVVTEPYPNRWTHHVLVKCPEEVDTQLMGWIVEAAAFSDAKS